jgi:GNAT superfamily N-acetyltransferase
MLAAEASERHWRRTDVWISLCIFFGNLAVIGPFFLTEYSNQPWNNSYIYMAISNLFRDHPWTWNRLQYAGAPFHYLYPPLFHVLVSAMPFVSVARAFHLVTGCGYALAPVCLYYLALQLFGSRLLGAFAALAYSLFPSPIYYLLPSWKGLAIPFANAPWGFVASIGYEEAAHGFAFSFTLLAVAAAWRNQWILSALLAGLVCLTNWPAMIGLALTLAAVAIARARDLGPITSGLRIFGVLGTAYGLSAFWITPGYFISSGQLNRIVIAHTNFISPWGASTALILMGGVALIGFSFWRRIPPPLALALAWFAVTGSILACFSLAGSWLIPMPFRYMLEGNAASILVIAGLVSLLPGPRWRYAALGVLTVVGFAASPGFLRQAWSFQAPPVDVHNVLSFRIAQWFREHAGNARVLASGEVDSTLALWSDVPQAGGTGQDVSNFLMFAAQRQIVFGCEENSHPDAATIAGLWLRALNVTYFLVHTAESREAYHWFTRPEKFAAWPVAWDDGAGDIVYRQAGQQEAVVVDLAGLRRLPPLRATNDIAFLQPYVSWAAGKRAVPVRWQTADRATLDVTLGPDEGVLLKSNYDRGWRVSDGTLAPDPIGFVLLKSGAGTRHLTLQFGASWDVWLGRAITLTAIGLLLAGFALPRIALPRIAFFCLVPTLVAYGILLHNAPASAAVAEEAFARIQPALISPRGVVDSLTSMGPPFGRGRLISAYGLNFGAGNDAVTVRIGERAVVPDFHSRNLVVFRLPADAGSNFTLSVEVNGCRGNEYSFATR